MLISAPLQAYHAWHLFLALNWMEIWPCVCLALFKHAARGRHLYVHQAEQLSRGQWALSPLDPGSQLPLPSNTLTEISSPRPPAYSLNRALNSLENFMRGPLRFCFMVRVRPGISNSLKAPRVIVLCSLNGTHSCSKFHVVGIT